eukprot:6502228-Prymnesium_polylepis.3
MAEMMVMMQAERVSAVPDMHKPPCLESFTVNVCVRRTRLCVFTLPTVRYLHTSSPYRTHTRGRDTAEHSHNIRVDVPHESSARAAPCTAHDHAQQLQVFA